MHKRLLRGRPAGLSLIAFALAAGLSTAQAQQAQSPNASAPPAAPNIVLPPLPDVVPALPGAPLTAPAAEGASPSVNAAAVSLPPVNQALQAAIAALTTPDALRSLSSTARKEREAIAAFYAGRSYAPLWLANDISAANPWTAAAKSALARLKRADEDGLDIAASHLPSLAAGDAATLAATELALSSAVVDYGEEASGSRVDPHAISPLLAQIPVVAEPAAILASVASAADADAALQGFNPPQQAYRDLRAKLADLRQTAPASAPVAVGDGPTLKVGMKDARVPLLRARFGIDLDATDPDERLYDAEVAAAVTDFQKDSGLKLTGTLTPATVKALAGAPPDNVEADVVANMELWRWEPRDMGAARIEVNIPEFALKVVRDDAIVHQARIIVGKPATPTPIFSNAVKFIVVNPTWTVPQSIIKKEMLPHLATDPNYLLRQGYTVTYQNGKMKVVQPAGDKNALGHIKFMFPNDFAVYLHDTPQRSLFNTSRRAYSHGCVRVDQPLDLAEIVLGADSGWTSDRIGKMIGSKERTINLPAALPIHIEYFTAEVDADGKLQLQDDIYGYTQKIITALHLAA